MSRKNTPLKRAMALMLAIIMIVGVLPASVFAAEEPEPTTITVTVDGKDAELKDIPGNAAWKFITIEEGQTLEFTVTGEGIKTIDDNGYPLITYASTTDGNKASLTTEEITKGKLKDAAKNSVVNGNNMPVEDINNVIAPVYVKGDAEDKYICMLFVEIKPAAEVEVLDYKLFANGEEVELTKTYQFDTAANDGAYYYAKITKGADIKVEATNGTLKSLSGPNAWAFIVTVSEDKKTGTVPYTDLVKGLYEVIYSNAEKYMKQDEAYGFKFEDYTNSAVKVTPFLDGKKSADSIFIEMISDVTGIKLDKTEVSVEAGKEAQLTATITPADALDNVVTWSSDKETVATVDQTGKVTANNVGEATITATAGGMTAECVVTVKEAEPEEPETTIDVSAGKLSDLGWIDKITIGGAKVKDSKVSNIVLWEGMMNEEYVNVTLDKETAKDAELTIVLTPGGENGVVLMPEGNFPSIPGDWSTKITTTQPTEAYKLTLKDGRATFAVSSNANIDGDCATTLYVSFIVDGVKLPIEITAGGENIDVEERYDCWYWINPYDFASYFATIPNGEDVTFKFYDRQGNVVEGLKIQGLSDDEYWDVTANEDGSFTVSKEFLREKVGCFETEYVNIFKNEYGVDLASIDLIRQRVAAESITLDKTEATIGVGKTLQLNATVLPENATDEITWESSKESVATVDENGVVTANNVGEATITATAGGMTAECVVTVKEAAPVLTAEVNGEDVKVSEHTARGDALFFFKVIKDSGIILSSSKGAITGFSEFDFTKNEDGSITVTAENIKSSPYGKMSDNRKNEFIDRCGLDVTDRSNDFYKSNIHVDGSLLGIVIFEIVDTYAEITGLTLDKASIEIEEGKTAQLIATTTPEGEPVSWSSDKESVATVDENGVVTANNVGEATITATAGRMTAECVVTVTANEIVVPEGHFEVTVKAPVGTDIEFFNGTDGKEAFTGTVVDDGTVENHHQYTIIAPKGMYSYRGMEGNQYLGGMAFKVPVDDEYASNGELMGKGQVITLKRVNYYPNHKDFNKVGQYAVTVVPKDLPEAVMGSQYVNDGGFVVTPLLANAAGNVITYQVAVDILDKDLMNKYGIDMLVNVTYGGSAVQESVFTVREISYYTVTAPKGAKVQGFNQLNNFNVRELDVHHTEELEDGMIKYYFAIGGQNATYRVSMDGKITRAGFFSKDGLYGKNKAKDVVITFNENENPQTTKTTAARIENSSILNVNPQNNLSLAVGEEFRLRSYRAGWQIINTDTANIMIEPDFHYNIISGAEHIKMTPADNQCTGNAGTGENTNWMDITAVSEGTVVLEISYDAIIIGGTTSYPGQFGAVDPSRKSVVVIEIGEEKEENTLEITSTHGTHSKWAWDADLSTVYMFGDKTDFSFTAKINDAQPDKVEFSNDLGKNWVEIKADNSVYTAKDVLPGNNLLKVTKGENVEYQVVRASKASIIVVNTTHPGDTIIAGDTIRVMFSGIYSPTPKMSGIYNPGFTSPNITQYTNTDESVTYSASSSQYGFAADNMMTIKFTEAGTFSFTDGYIPSAVMGNISGQHRSLTDAGCGTNMNARDGSSNRCVLPDLEFEVIDMPVVDVKITTNPKGAEITIDGQTPEADGTYKLEYGTYSYTAKLEGYVPANGRFTVGGDDRLTGKKDVIIDLKKIEGAIWNGSYKDKPNTDENGVYLIGTGAELAWYAINGGGADAKLTADISMGGYGVTIESLTGTFDGNGHYVTDFYHSESLFKWPKSGAVIKNLGVSGSTSGQGGIVTGRGSITYTIENCVSRVDVLSSGGAVGGILGNGESQSSSDMPKIINCYNAGTVTGYGEVGGIIGVNSTTPITYIVNCYNIGTVNKHAVARLGRGTIRNNYYLLGSATETSMTVGTAYTADVLKTIAKELGDAYLDNPTSYNDGYPILAWEEPRALEVAKAEFPAQLDGYKNVNDYLEEQKAELAQAIEAGKKAIAEATTLAGAVDAIEAAKALMDAIKTAEDIADENVAILARAKNEAKAAITSYKNADDYRDEQKAELSEAINEARKAIDAAETVEEVAAALTAAKKVLDAIPTDEELAIDEATTKVYLSISHDDKFVETESGEIMALRELNVPYFDLANYGLEKYYFVSESYDQGGQVGGNIGESSYEVYHGKVTVLHALIWATEVYYCGIEPEEAGNGYLYKKDLVETEVFSPEGSAGSMYIRELWGMDENFNYYFNYEYPLASEGWGSTADQILLEDGDIVTVGHFKSWNFHLDDLSVFNFIKAGDDIINTSAEKGEAVEMSVVLAAKGGNYTTAHIPMEGRGVFITKADELTANTAQWNFVGTTDENGNVVVYTDGLEAGKYVVGTPGQFGKTYTKDIVSTPGAIYLTVEETTHVHNFGEWNVIRQATCSEGGIQERSCEDCKAVDVKNIERLAHTPKVTGSIEATCEKEGYSGDTFCEVCEAKLATGAVVAAKGHSFGEWIVVKAASCTETGSEKRACACGKEETREVAKKAHTEEILKAVEATCTSEGLTEGKKCSVCGEILVKQTEVAKKAHTEEIIPGKEATAEESGLTEGKKCSVCGEILVKQEVIEKLVFGDADGDGSVSAKDATQILRYINGKTSAFDQGGEALETLADVNDDGVVDAKDATQILRHINGKASALDK